MNTFKNLTQILLKNKRIILLTTLIEMRKRYAGSILGAAWIFLFPALLLGMYMFIYQAVFKVKVTGIGSSFEYALFVLSGIIPYLGFSEVANSSASVMAQNRHLITNVIVPMEIIPVRQVCMALVSQCASLCILMLLLLFAGGKLSIYWAFVPAMIVLEFLFLVGMAYILAVLGVFMRDLAQVMGIITLFLMFVSPVGYTKEMVPAALQFVLYFNPVYYLVETFRDPLLYGTLPDLKLMSIYVFLCLGMFFVGGILFKKTLHTLSDLA